MLLKAKAACAHLQACFLMSKLFVLFVLLFTGISWQTRLIIPVLLPDISRQGEKVTARAKLTSAWMKIAATSPLHILNIFKRTAAGVQQHLKFAGSWSGRAAWLVGGCGSLYE